MLYVADLLRLIEGHRLTPHAYADDTQIYGFCPPSETDQLCEQVSACIDDVSAWMAANRLLMNDSKTEVLWCSSLRRQNQIPTASVRIGKTQVQPVRSVRDLGVLLDADVTFKTHVTATVRACFAALRRIRSVRRCLPRPCLLTLIRALVITKLDYCNSVLAGTPMYLQQRLQSVLNAAARLVFSARRSDHITPLLQELHWLRVPERIQFRLCVLAYRCLHGTAPSYIADDTRLTSGIEACRRLRSSSASTMTVPPVRRTTLGGRAFPVAAARAWNSLPPGVRTAGSLQSFRKNLKTHLFRFSFA